jgi:hypothetical protein
MSVSKGSAALIVRVFHVTCNFFFPFVQLAVLEKNYVQIEFYPKKLSRLTWYEVKF